MHRGHRIPRAGAEDHHRPLSIKNTPARVNGSRRMVHGGARAHQRLIAARMDRGRWVAPAGMRRMNRDGPRALQRPRTDGNANTCGAQQLPRGWWRLEDCCSPSKRAASLHTNCFPTQIRTASHRGRSLPIRKGQPPHRGGSLICQPRTASHRWRSLHSNNQRPTPRGWRPLTPPRSTRPRGWSLHSTTLHTSKRTSSRMVHTLPTKDPALPKRVLTPRTTTSLRGSVPHPPQKHPPWMKHPAIYHTHPLKKNVTRRISNQIPDSHPFNTASHRTCHIKNQQPLLVSNHPGHMHR